MDPELRVKELERLVGRLMGDNELLMNAKNSLRSRRRDELAWREAPVVIQCPHERKGRTLALVS